MGLWKPSCRKDENYLAFSQHSFIFVSLAFFQKVNPFEDDFKQNKTRIVSCILAGLGTIYFGILVGMVTQTVEETVNSFQNTRVPVLVSDHTVVAGWNSNIPLALRGRFEKIAILTTKESDEVVGDLRDTIGTGARRFYVRKGSPLLKTDLKRVNASAAHTIVVVPDITYRKDPTNKDVSTASTNTECTASFFS